MEVHRSIRTRCGNQRRPLEGQECAAAPAGAPAAAYAHLEREVRIWPGAIRFLEGRL
jgi:hypothetical protein